VGEGQSGQGATGESHQESCPEEGRCQEGGGKGIIRKGSYQDSVRQESSGTEDSAEEDGPCSCTGGNGSYRSVGDPAAQSGPHGQNQLNLHRWPPAPGHDCVFES